MLRSPLQIRLSSKDRQYLQAHLSGGVQPVGSVLRALALLQMAQGVSAAQIAGVVPLTAQAIRKVGHRFEQGGLERALFDKPRPGAAALLDDGQQQRPLDGAPGSRGGGRTTAGSSRGKRGHSRDAPEPRPQAVAGKECGAFLNSMTAISPTWKTSWQLVRRRTIPNCR